MSNGAISGTTGTFSSTLTANGIATLNNTTASTAFNNGALVVAGGVGVAGNLNVAGTSYANLANIQVFGNTIRSITTDGNINLDPNGTGSVVINSAQDNSKLVVKGTTASTDTGNLFVVSTGTNQVGVRQSTFLDGAAFQVNSTDSILLPVGAQSDRPLSPVAGMVRYSTTGGSIEWYNGTSWATASTAFTLVTANTITGDGSTTAFTLPVANATTAGTVVSINGIVQKPVDAYGISGATLTFTEAPASTDIVDVRIFTTSTSVTSVVDATGKTGVFLDQVVGDNVITFKNNDVVTMTLEADGHVVLDGGGFISNAAATTVGTSATTVDSFPATDYRVAKYVVSARDSGSTAWTALEVLVVHNGTAATATTYGIVNTGATTQVTMTATISGGNVLLQAAGAAAGTVVNISRNYIVGS